MNLIFNIGTKIAFSHRACQNLGDVHEKCCRQAVLRSCPSSAALPRQISCMGTSIPCPDSETRALELLCFLPTQLKAQYATVQAAILTQAEPFPGYSSLTHVYRNHITPHLILAILYFSPSAWKIAVSHIFLIPIAITKQWNHSHQVVKSCSCSACAGARLSLSQTYWLGLYFILICLSLYQQS